MVVTSSLLAFSLLVSHITYLVPNLCFWGLAPKQTTCTHTPCQAGLLGKPKLRHIAGQLNPTIPGKVYR